MSQKSISLALPCLLSRPPLQIRTLALTTTFALLGGATCSHAAPQNPIVVGKARFSVLTPNCIRIESAGADGKFVDLPSLFALNRDARFGDFKLEQSAQITTIDTGAMRLKYTPDGQPLSAKNLSAQIKDGQSWTPGAPNAGNLGGTLRTLDGVRGPVAVEPGLLSRDGWALVDNSRDPLLANDWVQARPQGAGNDWYLFGYGHDYRAALKSLTTVSGKVPLPRKNLLGTWYSRYWPISSKEYREFAGEYEQHDFPLDNMVLDMDWHRQGWTGWSWNHDLIPDPENLISDLHKQGLEVTLNLHPADGVAASEDQYKPFMAALGLPADGQTAPFDAADKKQVNALETQVLDPLTKTGVDFWWLDWQQYPATRGIPELTNLWWLNDVLFRYTQQGGRRGVSFSRWAGWGDQRHPIHFSGDASSDWSALAFQVPFTATSGNVGCFFWTHDIGGHNGGRNEESYARWCQFGALSAALRSHSSRDANTDRRPWKYPKWGEDSMRRSFHLRSELFPYIYSSAAQSTRDSVPLLRPMYFDNPNAEAAYHNGQEYLLGDNLLVAPIVSPGVGPNRVAHQAVWFPAGSDWFNTFTGEKQGGGTNALCASDINEFPLFARGGVPISMQPYTDRMTSAKISTLRMRAFPGAPGQSGRSELYEDDGQSDAYKTGAFAVTPLRYTRSGNRIEIAVGATKGKFDGQVPTRAVQIELPATARAQNAMLDGKAVPVRYDAATATNTIMVAARPIASGFSLTLDAADADFDALRNAAQARRMKGVTGRDFAPQSPRELLQNALTGELSGEMTDAQRDEALAVVGVGVVAQNQSPILARGDVRDVVYAPGVLDSAPTVETVSRSKVTLRVGGQKMMLPNLLGGDIAPAAKVTVSGAENGYGFAGATDKMPGGYPDDRNNEWSSGQKVGATIRLTWKTPQRIDRVALFDRPNENDNATRSLLTFSDGSTVEVGALPNDGQTPAEARFAPKTVRWVEWKVLAVSDATENVGLGEFAVFAAQGK